MTSSKKCLQLPLLFIFLMVLPGQVNAADSRGAPAEKASSAFPGTQLLQEGDFAKQMIDGIGKFLENKTSQSISGRGKYWNRDLSSPARYAESIQPKRLRLAAMIGVVDPRVTFGAPQLVATTTQPALVGKSNAIEIYEIRWPVVGNIEAEGLLLVPVGKKPPADVIAIPDADQTPSMLAGLGDGVAPESQFARRLAESGCRVIVPLLVDRSDTFSMPPSGQKTNQPHREYVYRPAYEMGRHIIGYEVQKVLALVDWLSKEGGDKSKIGVMGYGEGGLLALYSAAIDTRITAACVSGYFGPRERMWEEPIYRNVHGLLREFGDAEIAGLVMPRGLIIEACKSPELDGPPPERQGRRGAAPGKLKTPDLKDVESEFSRLKNLFENAPALCNAKLQVPKAPALGRGPFGASPTLALLLNQLGFGDDALQSLQPAPQSLHAIDWPSHVKRQIDQMQALTQSLVAGSEKVRKQYWAHADSSSLEKWEQSTAAYREKFLDDLIGRFDDKLMDPNVRTRKIYDEPRFVGYEVVMDVWPDVIANGILLIPKDLKEGERRPVVVCQHGLEGRPTDVADPKQDSHFYHRFACQLADQGFITYAPQNPYIGHDDFRVLIRKSHPLGASLYTFIIAQHQQTLNWLGSLPFVDAKRIAFYGLSYGGKTAMRIPAALPGYCLSICSGDFNQWLWKCTSIDFVSGYPGTMEYDMFEWNLGNTFNYAEMAALIAPRPFMVERGHRDGVGVDEWVAYEYAKVRRLYADLKIPDQTRIEFFDGPHTIHGVGTFEFLHEKLNWPVH
jgi:dienelactone hydrolase